MPSNDSLKVGLAGEVIKKIGNKSNTEILVAIFIFLIIFAVAIAPLKILLRRNFGNNVLNSVEIIFGAIFFAFWGYLACYLLAVTKHNSFDSLYRSYFFNSVVLGLIATIFVIISLVTLIKGFREINKGRFSHSSNWLAENFRGQSILYQKYVKGPPLQFKVWRKLEPAFCFRCSFVLLIIHPLLGFPLLFSSTAFWANEFYHVKFKWEEIDFSETNGFNEGSKGAH